MADKLKLGIPKGSLQDATIALFERAGWRIYANGRSYFPGIDDSEIECMLIRAQEMARYVEKGCSGCRAHRHRLGGGKRTRRGQRHFADLFQGDARPRCAGCLRCLRIPPFRRPKSLSGKVIATELVEVTKNYFAGKNVPVKVEFSWGATEVKPRCWPTPLWRYRDGQFPAGQPAAHHRYRDGKRNSFDRQSSARMAIRGRSKKSTISRSC